jgi:aminopeptidase
MNLYIFSLFFLLGGTFSQESKATYNSLLFGVYDDGTLTTEAQTFDSSVGGALTFILTRSPVVVPRGTARLLYNLDPLYDIIAVVGLGPKTAAYDPIEDVDLKLENIRTAVAAGVRKVRDAGERNVLVDSCGDATAAAEGAFLALFSFDEYKTTKTPILVTVAPYSPANKNAWDRGAILAEGQNIARSFMETPANILTPTEFSLRIQELFEPFSSTVTVFVHDKAWAEAQGMGSFLSVALGSAEPPKFVEVHYNNSVTPNEPPIIFVGKGITFDSGGISLKSPDNMGEMRADMTGAAEAIAAVYTLAKLGERVNVIALAPLTENMLGASATKPSDVVFAMNGKSIQIDDTDAEGRLVLADGLAYANIQYDPIAIVDIATLTGSIGTALGAGASGVFTTSDTVWTALHAASVQTGDRVWRMPLYKIYGDQMKVSQLADLNNVNTVSGSAGANTAAAFLQEFAEITNWAHLDIAGVFTNEGQVPYLGNGMSGRPIRTLVQFVSRFLIITGTD